MYEVFSPGTAAPPRHMALLHVEPPQKQSSPAPWVACLGVGGALAVATTAAELPNLAVTAQSILNQAVGATRELASVTVWAEYLGEKVANPALEEVAMKKA